MRATGTLAWLRHDWRPWLVLLATALPIVVDLLLPPRFIVLPFVVIPVVASAFLARPWFSVVLTALVVVVVAWSR